MYMYIHATEMWMYREVYAYECTCSCYWLLYLLCSCSENALTLSSQWRVWGYWEGGRSGTSPRARTTSRSSLVGSGLREGGREGKRKGGGGRGREGEEGGGRERVEKKGGSKEGGGGMEGRRNGRDVLLTLTRQPSFEVKQPPPPPPPVIRCATTRAAYTHFAV